MIRLLFAVITLTRRQKEIWDYLVAAAGSPIEALETEGRLAVPVDFVRRPHTAFTLRVRGGSMIGEGLLDGDLVVVEPRSSADNGEAVVAPVDGEATVKTGHRLVDGLSRLQPANPSMEPILAAGRGRRSMRHCGCRPEKIWEVG